jgi:DNA-directed RNA polymerase specialized sigma24 family protein
MEVMTVRPAPARPTIEVYASVHAPATLTAAYLLVGDWPAAEEAAAHALVAGRRASTSPDESAALVALARRHTGGGWRGRVRGGGLQLQEAGAPLTAAVDDPRRLWLGLSQLTERERAAVVLRGLLHLRGAEISTALARSPADVSRDLETADAIVAAADVGAAADGDLHGELAAFFAAHLALSRPTAAVERRAAWLERRRIRLLRLGIAVAASAAVALAGAGIVTTRPDGEADTDRAAAPTGPPGWVIAPPQPVLPRAGPDHKLVGFRTVVVAVPASWRQVASACGAVRRDAVVFPPRDGSGAQCGNADLRRGLSAVSFHRDIAGEPEVEGEFGPRRTRSGDLVVTRPQTRGGRYVAYASAPARGFGMTVVTDSRRALNRIIDSMTVLPAGYTTVPDCLGLSERQVVELLQRAGLVAQRLYDHSAIGLPMRVVQQSQSVGAVVPVQTRVTLGMLPR